MGNVHMEASQINYRGGSTKMSVEEAIKNAGNAGLAHTADIAPEFSATSAYTAGDIVYHDGSLYEFTANHAAGAWSTGDTQAVTVGGKITTLDGEAADLYSNKANQTTIAPLFSSETAYDPGDLVFYNGAAYRCVNAHEGAWDADDFSATTVANELSTLMSGLTNVILADLPTLYATKCAGTVAVHFVNTAFTPASDDLSTLIGSDNKPSRNNISTPVVEVGTGNILILTYKTTGVVELKDTQGNLIDHSASVYGTLVFNA